MKLITLVIFLGSCAFCLSAQGVKIEFRQLSNDTFTDGYKVDLLHEFEHVFLYDNIAYNKFKKFNKTRNLNKVLNYAFIISGITAIVSSIGDDPDGIGPLLFLTIGALSISTHVVFKKKINKLKGSLLEYYYNNQNSLSNITLRKQTKSILIKSNGIGFSIVGLF